MCASATCVGRRGTRAGVSEVTDVRVAAAVTTWLRWRDGRVPCAAPGPQERSQPCLRGPRCCSPWQPPHPPSLDRRRAGPAARKVSQCVRKAPTLTPGQPPDAALWQPNQVTACPPEPDVIGVAVRTLHVAWAHVGYGCTPDRRVPGPLQPPPRRRGGRSRAVPVLSRLVRGGIPYPENWAKRDGPGVRILCRADKPVDIVPYR